MGFHRAKAKAQHGPSLASALRGNRCEDVAVLWQTDLGAKAAAAGPLCSPPSDSRAGHLLWASVGSTAPQTVDHSAHLVREVQVSILAEMNGVGGSITTMGSGSEAKSLASQSDHFLVNGSNLLLAEVITC